MGGCPYLLRSLSPGASGQCERAKKRRLPLLITTIAASAPLIAPFTKFQRSAWRSALYRYIWSLIPTGGFPVRSFFALVKIGDRDPSASGHCSDACNTSIQRRSNAISRTSTIRVSAQLLQLSFSPAIASHGLHRFVSSFFVRIVCAAIAASPDGTRREHFSKPYPCGWLHFGRGKLDRKNPIQRSRRAT